MATLSDVPPAAPRICGDFEIGETLGKGLQGKVKLGRNVNSGEMVALKFIQRERMGQREMNNLEREIEAMKRTMTHPNVVQLKELHMSVAYPRKNGGTRDVIMIVLELASGSELFDVLMYTGSFPEAIARAYFQQLVSALQTAHTNNVFHRDLKPENLLLDGNFQLKVADFGLATVNPENQTSRTECGTRGYMAPEILRHQPYDPAAADIWSAGVVLFIMLSGFPPFQIAQPTDWWFRAVMNSNYDAFWAAHMRSASFSQGAMDLMNKIFVADPAQRASLDIIVADPWFQESNISPETLGADLQRRKTQVEREKRREKEAEMRKREAAKRAAGGGDFDPFASNTTRAVGAESSAAVADGPLAQLLPTGGPVARYTCFYSEETAGEILGRIAQAFSAIFAEHTVKQEVYKVKAAVTMPGGDVQVSAQVFRSPDFDGVHVVEVRRRMGDVIRFQEVYKMLCDNLGDIICVPPGEEGDAAQDCGAAAAGADEEELLDSAEMI